MTTRLDTSADLAARTRSWGAVMTTRLDTTADLAARTRSGGL